MKKQKYHHLLKFVLIGDSTVGKSSLLLRFADNKFNTNYLSTIGVDFRFKTIKIQGKVVKLQIWDTAGQEKFRTITSAYYKSADGILIVYDSSNRDSFDSLDSWMFEVEKNAGSGVEKVILANKSDLKDPAVPKSVGEEYAAKNGAEFLETSAKEDHEVTRAFTQLAERIITKKTEKAKDITININVNQSVDAKPPTLKERMGRCCQ